MKFKEVNYKIKVPEGKNCVKVENKTVQYCPHFTNSNGYPSCEIGFKALEKVNSGVRKPKGCMELI